MFNYAMTDPAGYWHMDNGCKNWVSLKIKILFSGAFPRTLELENVATACETCSQFMHDAGR